MIRATFGQARPATAQPQDRRKEKLQGDLGTMAALPEGKAESLSPEANAMLDACGRFEDVSEADTAAQGSTGGAGSAAGTPGGAAGVAEGTSLPELALLHPPRKPLQQHIPCPTPCRPTSTRTQRA